MQRTLVMAVLLAGSLAGQAAAQATSEPPASNPPAPSPEYYVPLFGVTAGIAIPVGRLSDDHAAGYMVGGVVEYAVKNQPYSLRGELNFQRFNLKEGHAGDDMNLLSAGTTIVYRLQRDPAPFLSAGIAIYNGTREGTRPGFNLGTGVEIPLTGFTAVARRGGTSCSQMAGP